jgi:DNA modification methylase
MIKQQDSLAFLKEQPDLSVDINYSDPPYALGSDIIIRPDGKVDYKNTHPTLKPIVLNEKVLKLFKTPNDQRIIYPFGGAGSEIIGGLRAGFTNWSACELSPEYVEIAKARIEYWTNISHTTNNKPASTPNGELVQNKVEQIALV